MVPLQVHPWRRSGLGGRGHIHLPSKGRPTELPCTVPLPTCCARLPIRPMSYRRPGPRPRAECPLLLDRHPSARDPMWPAPLAEPCSSHPCMTGRLYLRSAATKPWHGGDDSPFRLAPLAMVAHPAMAMPGHPMCWTVRASPQPPQPRASAVPPTTPARTEPAHAAASDTAGAGAPVWPLLPYPSGASSRLTALHGPRL